MAFGAWRDRAQPAEEALPAEDGAAELAAEAASGEDAP
jgi:hypothetical protein